VTKIIYTNRAIKKISDQGLEKWQVEKTLNKPDLIRPSTAPGCKNYIQVNNHLEIGATIKKTDDGNWLVISAWKRELTK
jgi:hypothetical protein